MSGNYDDIIHLPHPTSERHVRMPMIDRAAQFSPFAALTGFDDAIEETGRLTQFKIQLDESAIAELDRTLGELAGCIGDQPEVTVTHFEQDVRKSGGAYVKFRGKLKKIDEYTRRLIFTDGTAIYIDDILSLSADA